MPKQLYSEDEEVIRPIKNEGASPDPEGRVSPVLVPVLDATAAPAGSARGAQAEDVKGRQKDQHEQEARGIEAESKRRK